MIVFNSNRLYRIYPVCRDCRRRKAFSNWNIPFFLPLTPGQYDLRAVLRRLRQFARKSRIGNDLFSEYHIESSYSSCSVHILRFPAVSAAIAFPASSRYTGQRILYRYSPPLFDNNTNIV